MKLYEYPGIIRNYIQSEQWSELTIPKKLHLLEYFTGNEKTFDLPIAKIKEMIFEEFQEIPLNCLDSSIKSEDTIGSWKELRKKHILVGEKANKINRTIKFAEKNLENSVLKTNFVEEASSAFKKMSEKQLDRAYKLNRINNI